MIHTCKDTHMSAPPYTHTCCCHPDDAGCVCISLSIICSGSLAVLNYGAFYLNGLCFPATPTPAPETWSQPEDIPPWTCPLLEFLPSQRREKRREERQRHVKKGRSGAQVSFACRLSIRHQTAALRGGSTRHFWAPCVDPLQLHSLSHVFNCTLRSFKVRILYLCSNSSWKSASCSVEFQLFALFGHLCLHQHWEWPWALWHVKCTLSSLSQHVRTMRCVLSSWWSLPTQQHVQRLASLIWKFLVCQSSGCFFWNREKFHHAVTHIC